MKIHYKPIISFGLLTLVVFSLVGCTLTQKKIDATQVVSVIHTAAAQTIVASIPTATDTPRPTITMVPTDTPIASLTPAGNANLTAVSTTSGIADIPCDNAKLIASMEPSNTDIFFGGETFLTMWRVANTGSCSWMPGYKLTFILGEKFSGGNAVIQREIKPGNYVIFTLDMEAPLESGLYTGYWRMYNNSGNSFGESMGVSIVVTKPTSTPTPITPTKTPKPPKPTKTPTPLTPTKTPKP